jgi:hypothetical protein
VFRVFKKLIAFNIVISIFQLPLAFAANSQINSQFAYVECAPELNKSFKKLQQLPEVRELIIAIQQEGPIRIMKNNDQYLSQQFGAFWDVENRIIFVNCSDQRSEGKLLSSILFELHNASINSKLEHLDYLASTGRIDKEKYVESVEYLEYQNSINASNIAEKGIRQGIFPTSARLYTYDSFEEHYRMQKFGGHSAWIARTYDQLAPKVSFDSNRQTSNAMRG